jgi:hypothetical protein
MNIYHKIEDIDSEKISFYKPIVNKFSNYNLFYKILYNQYSFTLNTILIMVELQNYTIYEENKRHKLVFNIDHKFIEKMKNIENVIMDKINKNIKKDIILSCNNNLINNRFVYLNNFNKNFKMYLRISGIWESDKQIGLTSKLVLYEK